MSHRDVVLEIPDLWYRVLLLLGEHYHQQQCPYVIYKALLVCKLLYYSHIHGSQGQAQQQCVGEDTHLVFHSGSVDNLLLGSFRGPSAELL